MESNVLEMRGPGLVSVLVASRACRFSPALAVLLVVAYGLPAPNVLGREGENRAVRGEGGLLADTEQMTSCRNEREDPVGEGEGWRQVVLHRRRAGLEYEHTLVATATSEFTLDSRLQAADCTVSVLLPFVIDVNTDTEEVSANAAYDLPASDITFLPCRRCPASER